MGEQVDARLNGDVAQLGEHLPCKQEGAGSIPVSSTIVETQLHLEVMQMKRNMLWGG